MISSLDAGVGRLRQTLAGLGIADNTVVVFTSDNGGLSTLAGESRRAPTSNAPLRAGKGWLYEGGTRVPLVVLWPGETPSGSETTVRCSSADLYPTLLEIAGLPLRPHQHRDGVSLAPVLRGQAEIAPRTLYWHFPHYHGSGSRPSSSIIEGNLKLIEWLEDSTLELYDLEIDPGETTDLATRRPDDAQRLRQHLAAWQRTVGARMPRQNPAWPGPPSERG